MSRHPELEAILQARYDLQTSEPSRKSTCLHRYHELLDQAIARGSLKSVTRDDLEKLLASPYREFRKAKLSEERDRLSRLR